MTFDLFMIFISIFEFALEHYVCWCRVRMSSQFTTWDMTNRTSAGDAYQ